MSSATTFSRRLLACALLLPLLAAACATPEAPSHFTRLWPEGTTGSPIIGTSTEDGILLLSRPEFRVGDRFELQFPVGNSLVRDWARLDRVNDNLAVARPLTARIVEGRIARELPRPDDKIFLAVRNQDDEPWMTRVRPWRGGMYGDWITVSGADPEAIARDYQGTGLYIVRNGRWQIIGVLTGLLAEDERDPRGETALGYIGLLEMSRILPDHVPYFEHDIKPLRPDFEFGVPLQPGDIDLDEEGAGSQGR
ncbi:MAG: hypothetical protein ACYTCU_10945 [Planctomycetota bacterium]|jgi:hypothetical protein